MPPKELYAELVCGQPNVLLEPIVEAMGGKVSLFVPRSIGALLERVIGFDGVLAESLREDELRVVFAGHDRPRILVSMRSADMQKTLAVFSGRLKARFREEKLGKSTRYVPTDDGKVSYVVADDAVILERALLPAGASAPEAPIGESASAYLASLKVQPGCRLHGSKRAVLDLSAQFGKSWTSAREHLESMDKRSREEHGGRAPDFGEPKEFLAAGDGIVEEVRSVLSATTDLEATFRLEKGEWRINASVLPDDAKAKDLHRTMRALPSEELLNVSADAAFSLLLVSPPEERVMRASSIAHFLEKAVKGVGDLGPVIADVSKARGDSLTISGSDRPPSLAWETTTSDRVLAEKAQKSMFDKLETPAVRALLRERFGVAGLVRSSQTVEGLGPWSTVALAGPMKMTLGGSITDKKWRLLFSDNLATAAKTNFLSAKKLNAELSLPEEFQKREVSFGMLIRKRAKDTSEARVRLLTTWGREGERLNLSAIADEKTFLELGGSWFK